MKPLALTAVVAALLAATLAQAAPADEVKAAARKLADAANYTWQATTLIADPAPSDLPQPIICVRQNNSFAGYALLGGLAYILSGRGAMVMKGDKHLQMTPQGWLTSEELAAVVNNAYPALAVPRLPTQEIIALVGRVKELKSADGMLTGDLTTADAGSLLLDELRRDDFALQASHRRSEIADILQSGNFASLAEVDADEFDPSPALPQKASGAVRIWLKDGIPVKYEVQVKGAITRHNGTTKDFDRTLLTEIKAIGTTEFKGDAAIEDKLDGKPALAAPSAPTEVEPSSWTPAEIAKLAVVIRQQPQLFDELTDFIHAGNLPAHALAPGDPVNPASGRPTDTQITALAATVLANIKHLLQPAGTAAKLLDNPPAATKPI